MSTHKTFTVTTSDSGAAPNEPITIQGLDELSFTTTMADHDLVMGSDCMASLSPESCFVIEGDAHVYGSVVVTGELQVHGSLIVSEGVANSVLMSDGVGSMGFVRTDDAMYMAATDSPWVGLDEVRGPEVPAEIGFAMQVPRIVLTAETELELEALRTLVYDAQEKGHEKADQWASALEEFKAFRKDHY